MSCTKEISRRVFIARASSLILTLGTGSLWLPRSASASPKPYARGVWLAGDHHIHTKYSPDGQYEIERQVANAAKYGLHWCVITDRTSAGESTFCTTLTLSRATF